MGRGRSSPGAGLHHGDGPGPRRRLTTATRDDRGAAVVDFALVSALLTLVLVGVVQLAVVLHVRATVVDCAAEGARYGALADRTPEDGAERTRELLTAALSPAYARDVRASVRAVGGRELVEVRVRAPLPVAGLVGVGDALDLTGRGLVVEGGGA
ncbi:TadE/TadG family type IV pilus assembly protein [Pseudokineococcus sp. 5B2Z-1]|uniref:TadE/TadG family type IV pilus assembly protein n=1 Tax=Pseudokineococcus sp. 5B2Z-1 TaxID=3132744 RepID=UPI0030965C05